MDQNFTIIYSKFVVYTIFIDQNFMIVYNKIVIYYLLCIYGICKKIII